MMTAEIITIGTEIILGQIVDTNAAYIADTLTKKGLSVLFKTSVGDDSESLKSALKTAQSRVSLIVTTGGLGPTVNDITRETISDFFNMPLLSDNDTSLDHKQYENDKSIKLTHIPSGSKSLPNDHGTAIGFYLTYNNTEIVCLPGVPHEMRPMLNRYLEMRMTLISAEEQCILTRRIHTFGIPEYKIEKIVQECNINQNLSQTITLVKNGIVTIQLTTKAITKSEALHLLDTSEEAVRKKLGIDVFGTDNTSLEYSLYQLMHRQKKTIAVAESCTGGLVSNMLTNIPGISECFLQGIIAYSNQAKINYLGVSGELIKEYGAVSPQVAEAMATGIKEKSGSNIGIGITGIAGPSGGTREKPVGLVYIGIAVDNFTTLKKCQFHGTRTAIKYFSANTALNMVRLRLLKPKFCK